MPVPGITRPYTGEVARVFQYKDKKKKKKEASTSTKKTKKGVPTPLVMLTMNLREKVEIKQNNLM